MESRLVNGPTRAEHDVRHMQRRWAVPQSMSTVRSAFPLIRALALAAIVTLLIMIGLPTLLAAAAAAS